MITALVSFVDPRTGRAYQPGDVITGLSSKRAAKYVREGLVKLSPSDPPLKKGKVDYHAPLAMTEKITDKDLMDEYDERFRNDPGRWSSITIRNEGTWQYLLKHLGHEPESVVDIGCGNGHTLEYLAEKWPHAELFGLDLSREGLKLTYGRVPKAKLFNGFIENWVPPKQFEAVICLGTMEHMRDVPKSLAAFKKLISPEGFGYIEVPNCLAYDPGDEGFRRLAVGSQQWEWHLKRETWEALLCEAGLVIQGSYIGSRPMWEFLWVVK